jgi:hypothetical protein
MTDAFVKKSVLGTVILVVSVALILALFGKLAWGIGLCIGAAWSCANFLLTIYLTKIVLLERNKGKLWLILGIKFPVLYLLGFWLLISRSFPVLSILTGLFPIFVVAGVFKLCQKPA